ncbi:acyltransferase domain-containing protein, partial [Streptomyces sp. URMC 123]|uniref:acyltransferase domain-containing protein n=1 Tax=Streptomyces sp. URMC 123 TaxID=3423403 RepID=UPI003F1AA704
MTAERPVVFLLPGAGSQHPGMGRGLYETEPVYRREIDRCADLLRGVLDRDLRDLLYGTDAPPAGDGPRADTAGGGAEDGVFPTLVAAEYALARLLMSWGIRPAALLGHSLGEYTAACLSGVVALADVLPLVVRRERLFARAAGDGGMLSVALGEEACARYLVPGLCLAAVNGPRSCALAGPLPALAEAERRLAGDGVPHRRIRFGAAAHSALLDPVLDTYRADVAAVPLRAPEIPYVSNLTGTWITADRATDPDHWVRHTREPVRFGAGLEHLRRELRPIFLEVGPGRVLTRLVEEQCGPDADALPTMRHPQAREPDRRTLLDAVGRLWTLGAEVDWPALHAERPRRRVPLPGYPFARRRHWIEPAHR